MTFWAYMLHCRGGYFYTGHTDNLERRVAEHEAGVIIGFTSDHLPVKLVWSEEFVSRIEALEAEKRIKGWSRAKKMALLRGDWAKISTLAKSKNSPSTATRREPGRTGVDDKMPVSLSCHADTVCNAAASITVSVLRKGNLLNLSYVVCARIDKLVLPKVALPARTDGLWQTTCFEVFIRLAEDKSYIEFNASPSSQWAAYRFDDYRAGMAKLPIETAPEIGNDASESHFALEVTYDLLPEWAGQPLELGLSAVIEESDGTKSYWALAHPPGAPDFHHGDCFALQLAAPDSP
jgi:predicted GIY-YIG superfamily endonuclease